MRHRRKRDISLQLKRSLFLSLLEHGTIKTTLHRAKALRPFAEHLITIAGKNDTVAGRRLVTARLGTKNERMVSLVAKLFKDIAPGYKNRPGGYSRVLKCGFRSGDNSPMAIIQLVEADSN